MKVVPCWVTGSLCIYSYHSTVLLRRTNHWQPPFPSSSSLLALRMSSSSNNTPGYEEEAPVSKKKNQNESCSEEEEPVGANHSRQQQQQLQQLQQEQPVPRIDSVRTIASTKWLALQTMQYTDREGQSRQWDLATRRVNTQQPEQAPQPPPHSTHTQQPDAVAIIPLLRHPDDPTVLDTLLVEQYRPPVRQVTVEFPAGLVDAHETVAQAALRELREETGYVGEACRIPPTLLPVTCCMSPGLCDETIQVVLVQVDLSNPYNQGTPQPQLDPGEHCVVKRVRLQDGLRQILDQGTAMPIMGLYLFALGWELGAASTTTMTTTTDTTDTIK